MAAVTEVNPHRIGPLYVDGLELPYIEFGNVEPAVKLVLNGEAYFYWGTLPLKGYGAVLGRHARQLLAEGKKLLLARYGNRIYIFATGVTPIGSGGAPGAEKAARRGEAEE